MIVVNSRLGYHMTGEYNMNTSQHLYDNDAMYNAYSQGRQGDKRLNSKSERKRSKEFRRMRQQGKRVLASV